MAKQRNAVRAGIFMLISVALVLFVIIAISGAGRFTQSFITYPVAFSLKDDIGGLQTGDDVRIGGLKVGTVQAIELRTGKADPTEETPSIVVFIDVPSRFHIAKNADIHVQIGITGPPTINIDGFGHGDLATSSDYLIGQSDALATLLHKIGDLEPDLSVLVSNLKVASGKLNGDLDRIGNAADAISSTGVAASTTILDIKARVPMAVERYHAFVNSAVRMLDAIDVFFGPSSTNFQQTLANLNKISGNIKEKLPSILDKLDVALTKAGGAVDHAIGALIDVQKAAANLKDATASLRSVLIDNHGKLDAIIAGLKDTSDNLKYASTEVRHSPWRLLYQPKPDEVANLNIYDSVRQFAQGADSLDDAAVALHDMLKDPNADPAQVKKLMTQLDDSFANFQQVQSKLWKDIHP